MLMYPLINQGLSDLNISPHLPLSFQRDKTYHSSFILLFPCRLSPPLHLSSPLCLSLLPPLPFPTLPSSLLPPTPPFQFTDQDWEKGSRSDLTWRSKAQAQCTGCPQEGKGMQCQGPGGVRRVFMQKGSLWHGKSEPKPERKTSTWGKGDEEMGDEVYLKEYGKHKRSQVSMEKGETRINSVALAWNQMC